MKRTDNNQGHGIRKFFPVTFVHVSFAIVKIAIVSVLFICIVLLLPAGISQARDVEKIQPANPVALPLTSFKTIIVDNYYPYTFVNDKGISDGFSVEIAKAVASVMDFKLIISVDTWEHATKALEDGIIDLLPMMAYSPERDNAFDFSAPHTIAYDAVFLRNGAQRISSLEDLVGKTVIVMNKDAAHQYLLSNGMAVKMKLILVDSLPDALRTLAEGKGDAALMPKLVGLITMKKLNLTNLDSSPVVIDAYNRPFCFAVKDENQALLERLSQGLSIIKATGQYQEIYKKWFGALEPPGLSRVTIVKYIAGIVAVSLLIGLGLIIWNVSLRNQVALRTEKIEAEIQERKRAEEALRISEEEYRSLIENQTELVCRFNPDGTFIFVNDMYCHFYGKTKDELIGNKWFPLPVDEDLRDIQEKLLTLSSTNPIVVIENRVFSSKGDIHWIQFVNKGFFDLHGNLLEIQSVGRDITERKLAEEALRESELEYRSLIECSSDAVFCVDEKGQYKFTNHLFASTFGKTPDYFIGKTFWDIYPKEHADQRYAVTKRVFKTGESESVEVEVPLPDKTLYFYATANPIKDETGKVIQILTHATNITERKRAEAALRESEERYRTMMEQAADSVFMHDETGRILDVNRKACQTLGYSREELLSKSIRDIDPEAIQTEKHELWSKILTGENFTFESCQIRKDGSTIPVEVTLGSVRLPLGQAILGIVRDITERKRMENELLKADKLESVGILAGGIAHDFNNILTSISGNISMAKMQVKPDHKIFDLLSAAENASVRAQGLTRQLLTFAKGGTPLKETVFLKEPIKESSLFVLRGSKSECNLSISEDLWPVEADAGQISQVISNIVINANQAMPEGGVIQIEADNLMPEKIKEIPVKPGKYIRISIKDQGVGIPEKHLLKIFDPYFTTKQAGSGLGLATAYSIINKHNGHISVNSLPGAGTTFHIYLPASDKKVPVKEEALLLTGQAKILMMDDDEFLKELAKEIFDMLGYESAFAKNGAETIEMYKRAMESGKPYDAVILDLTIPGSMGGKEVIKILLNIDPEVKGIVCSGYSEDEIMSNFREYGFKGMMPKPFDAYKLGKVLNDVLK